ncbi:MAG: riboflavin kinase [Bacteroidales bacterium]
MKQQLPYSPEVIALLLKGDVGKARELTGFAFSLPALVVHGNHLGRTLGYPTANLDFFEDHPFILSTGVYAVTVDTGLQVYKGMANAGFRPTIEGKSLVVEVNLFDFSGDLYGKTLVVAFINRIRDEQKFESLDQLVKQLARDKQTALKLLS